MRHRGERVIAETRMRDADGRVRHVRVSARKRGLPGPSPTARCATSLRCSWATRRAPARRWRYAATPLRRRRPRDRDGRCCVRHRRPVHGQGALRQERPKSEALAKAPSLARPTYARLWIHVLQIEECAVGGVAGCASDERPPASHDHLLDREVRDLEVLDAWHSRVPRQVPAHGPTVTSRSPGGLTAAFAVGLLTHNDAPDRPRACGL